MALLNKVYGGHDSQKKGIDSDCDHTMIGFVHDKNVTGTFDNHPITCFYGSKDEKYLYEKQVAAVDGGNVTSYAQKPDLVQDEFDLHFV